MFAIQTRPIFLLQTMKNRLERTRVINVSWRIPFSISISIMILKTNRCVHISSPLFGIGTKFKIFKLKSESLQKEDVCVMVTSALFVWCGIMMWYYDMVLEEMLWWYISTSCLCLQDVCCLQSHPSYNIASIKPSLVTNTATYKPVE